MDYAIFCRSYFEATGLPVDLLQEGKPVFSSLGSSLNLPVTLGFDLFPMDRNPSFCSLNQDILYGRVHIENTNFDIILGPAFAIPPTAEMVRQYMQELIIPPEHFEALADVLQSLPAAEHTALSKHMAAVFFCVNGREADLFRLYEGMEPSTEARGSNQERRMDDLDEGNLRSTYLFEIGMYECIKAGQTDRLISYFQENTKRLYEGRLAESPLRHAKNLFITNVSKVALVGAIPGGMEAEKAYQLTEYYIRECEKLTTVESVNSLQYAMVLDFCRRTGEAKIPQGISAEVFTCINFIRSHINVPLTVKDVADHIHRSESYISKKFAADLGFSVNTFITSCRLEEAKSMLIFTEKSLAEISAYLCFSSQSYFQNVFKKKFGITPMQFRKQGQRVY